MERECSGRSADFGPGDDPGTSEILVRETSLRHLLSGLNFGRPHAVGPLDDHKT